MSEFHYLPVLGDTYRGVEKRQFGFIVVIEREGGK